jgi:hypothetical protein
LEVRRGTAGAARILRLQSVDVRPEKYLATGGRPAAHLQRTVRTGTTWTSRGSGCCRSQVAGDPRLRGAEKIASKLAPTGGNVSEGSRGAACGFLQSVDVRPEKYLETGGSPCSAPVANCANPYDMDKPWITLL